MKKIGIIMAALVITMFFVGAVAAMPANNPPVQREKFREDCKVQGVGEIFYEKKILDKEIAVDVEEFMVGNGSFAMTLTEILNEGVRLNCTANCSAQGTIPDPIYGDAHSPVMVNFECKKMIQFEAIAPGNGLSGTATYNNPGFHGGMNAKVTENYGKEVWVPVYSDGTLIGWDQQAPLLSLQKDEKVTMTTTATFDKDAKRKWDGCGLQSKPYTANELNFDTKNAFIGAWETQSSWKKVCSKNVQHHQRFIGDFQVDKNLIFKEEVTKECPEKVENGDC